MLILNFYIDKVKILLQYAFNGLLFAHYAPNADQFLSHIRNKDEHTLLLLNTKIVVLCRQLARKFALLSTILYFPHVRHVCFYF